MPSGPSSSKHGFALTLWLPSSVAHSLLQAQDMTPENPSHAMTGDLLLVRHAPRNASEHAAPRHPVGQTHRPTLGSQYPAPHVLEHWMARMGATCARSVGGGTWVGGISRGANRARA
jgi:hypothetical protein